MKGKTDSLTREEYARDPYVGTASSKKLHLLHPYVEDIDLSDIVHALSNQCRFAGHCPRFFSVAQHSVLVSQLIPLVGVNYPDLSTHGMIKLLLPALMHDAAEAYTGDIVSPLRDLLPRIEEISRGIDAAIAVKMGYDSELLYHPLVKECDLIVLVAEMTANYNYNAADQVVSWHVPVSHRWAALMPRIVPLPPMQARTAFLERLEEIGFHGV